MPDFFYNSVNSSLLIGIIGLAVIGLFLLGMLLGRLKAELHFKRRLRDERHDAVKRSRAVLNGQFGEQLAPIFPNFPVDPTELRFIGKPLDFIAFQDISSGTISEVVFIEVKSGKARLSAIEKSLKECVEQGRVRYVEYRLPF